ncbi:MAG: bifunctional NADH-specific enoyl-ACP reductase/trans-2-enoyl-CoA reductase, partial [Oscillospiraceae bacterium]|nr:bifunctional NADH-specific enoyl-ACP reductase/trans-2-enoyl-CoA reductase [Oscillospiraceae bacterium]
DIQKAVLDVWDNVSTENIKEVADIEGYWSDFFGLFGFGADGVDYDADTNPVYDIDSLK